MEKRIKNVTIGSDPECFIYDASYGEYISSIGIIPGVKGNAHPMKGLGEGYGLQIDNVLVEFNIPPTSNKNDFIESLENGKKWILDFLKRNVSVNYELVHCATASFSSSQLRSKEAKEFGCSVDYNAWTEEANPKPNGVNTNLRTTGCHIHVGWDNPNTSTRLELIKAMDLFLGVPSIILDDDSTRRNLYGKAGAFRITPYGVEYRVLSGFFLSNKSLEGWMFDQTMKAIDFVNEGNKVLNINNTIVNTINESNYEMAYIICAENNISVINNK